MGPVCRSENRSAPAEPTDFSWHLAAIEKKKHEMLTNVTKTHNDCFILCYRMYRLGTSSLMGFYGHLEIDGNVSIVYYARHIREQISNRVEYYEQICGDLNCI